MTNYRNCTRFKVLRAVYACSYQTRNCPLLVMIEVEVPSNRVWVSSSRCNIDFRERERGALCSKVHPALRHRTGIKLHVRTDRSFFLISSIPFSARISTSGLHLDTVHNPTELSAVFFSPNTTGPSVQTTSPQARQKHSTQHTA